MSKYIIELDYDLQRVVGIGVKQGTAWVKDYDVDDLEELCADYINEHYGSLQDDAYKRGVIDGSIDVKERVDGAYQKRLEDGKAIHEKGCEGCEYTVMGSDTAICSQCCNAYHNQWKAKDDKIEVGDEVDWSSDSFIVTRIFHAITGKVECDGVDMDGCTYHDVLMDDLEKTGRHFDIEKILEDMKS